MKERNSRPTMDSLTAEEAEAAEDVRVSRATDGVSLEKKEEVAWWVGAASKERRRKLGYSFDLRFDVHIGDVNLL